MNSVAAFVDQLAGHMKKNPAMRDIDLIRLSKKFIGIIENKNYGPSMDQYSNRMREVYINAIEDLSNGAPMLRTHRLGVVSQNGELKKYSVPYDEAESFSNVVCSIGLINQNAFTKNNDTNEDELFPQEYTNAAVYYLVYLISKIS